MTNSEPSAGPQPATSQRDLLPLATKLAYGAGDLFPAVATNVISFFLLFFLVTVAGVSAFNAGVILALGRLVDALTDPIMGMLTDRTRSRFGRRRPWILFGAIPYCLVFCLMWLVPPIGETGQFIYYLAMVLLYSITFTVVSVPYTALTPELTYDYHERTSLNSFRFAFSIGGSLLGLILHQTIVGQFAAPQTGYAVAGAVIGGLGFLPFVWCFCGVRERYRAAEQAAPTASLPAQLRIALRNRPYLAVIGIYLCSWMAVQATAAVLPFYITFWLQLGNLQLPMIAAVQGSSFVFLFVWSAVSSRMGKKTVYFLGMAFWIVVQAALFFVQPGQMILAFVLAILAGVGVAVAYLIPWSMMPDVIEYDELQTGQRREGIFYGFMVFAQKLGLGLGLFLVGVILGWQGFQEPAPGQDLTTMGQPDTALTAIRVMIGPVPTVLLVLGMLLTWYYPITQAKHAAMRAELAARAQQTEPSA